MSCLLLHLHLFVEIELIEPLSCVCTNCKYCRLEAYIDALSNHILEIQEQELAITKNFSDALKKAKEDPKDKKDKSKHDIISVTEPARNLYLKQITDIREKRKQYREMLYDALQERKKLWDSMQIVRDEDELLRRKVCYFNLHLKQLMVVLINENL